MILQGGFTGKPVVRVPSRRSFLLRAGKTLAGAGAGLLVLSLSVNPSASGQRIQESVASSSQDAELEAARKAQEPTTLARDMAQAKAFRDKVMQNFPDENKNYLYSERIGRDDDAIEQFVIAVAVSLSKEMGITPSSPSKPGRTLAEVGRSIADSQIPFAGILWKVFNRGPQAPQSSAPNSNANASQLDALAQDGLRMAGQIVQDQLPASESNSFQTDPSVTKAVKTLKALEKYVSSDNASWPSVMQLYQVDRSEGEYAKFMVGHFLGSNSIAYKAWDSTTNPRWRAMQLRKAFAAMFNQGQGVLNGEMKAADFFADTGMTEREVEQAGATYVLQTFGKAEADRFKTLSGNERTRMAEAGYFMWFAWYYSTMVLL